MEQEGSSIPLQMFAATAARRKWTNLSRYFGAQNYKKKFESGGIGLNHSILNHDLHQQARNLGLIIELTAFCICTYFLVIHIKNAESHWLVTSKTTQPFP